MVGSIDNFTAHYLHYLFLKRVYKKWCMSLENFQNFNGILCNISYKTFVWILFSWMQTLKLHKNHLISYFNLLCSSWAIKQFCFFDHFLVDLSNRFWNPGTIGLSCNINYYFDYLDEKSIFFAETKNAEYLLVVSTLWIQKFNISTLLHNFL